MRLLWTIDAFSIPPILVENNYLLICKSICTSDFTSANPQTWEGGLRAGRGLEYQWSCSWWYFSFQTSFRPIQPHLLPFPPTLCPVCLPSCLPPASHADLPSLEGTMMWLAGYSCHFRPEEVAQLLPKVGCVCNHWEVLCATGLWVSGHHKIGLLKFCSERATLCSIKL